MSGDGEGPGGVGWGGRKGAVVVSNREQGAMKVLGFAKTTGAAMLLLLRPEYIAAG